MFLGIEIGGTKLQLGVGAGDGQMFDLVRRDIDPSRGAAGILEQIDSAAAGLLQKHSIERLGIGFGGPIDAAAGLTTKSHQISGWDNFPLARWCQERLQRPAILANDCDSAAVGEARFGAGHGAASVFYVTVGTGIGGGFVTGGRLHGAGRPAASEIGHLRPGLNADRPELTVESLAAGPAIAAAAYARMTGQVSRSFETIRGPLIHPNREQVQQRLADVKNAEQQSIADLASRCGNNPDRLTAKLVAQAAADGNEIARQVLDHACQALGWAIAQVITLVAPEMVIVGGGVSLIGEPFFFIPLRAEVARYVFPPLAGSYQVVPAALGELAVVHGAIALAADAVHGPTRPTATAERHVD
jgi:glucokinase